MITFDQARELVELEWPRGPYAEFFPTWDPFEAATTGAEDESSFRVGSAKAAGENAVDVPVIFVEKSSGAVTFEPLIENFERLGKMTEVSSTT